MAGGRRASAVNRPETPPATRVRARARWQRRYTGADASTRRCGTGHQTHDAELCLAPVLPLVVVPAAAAARRRAAAVAAARRRRADITPPQRRHRSCAYEHSRIAARAARTGARSARAQPSAACCPRRRAGAARARGAHAPRLVPRLHPRPLRQRPVPPCIHGQQLLHAQRLVAAQGGQGCARAGGRRRGGRGARRRGAARARGRQGLTRCPPRRGAPRAHSSRRARAHGARNTPRHPSSTRLKCGAAHVSRRGERAAGRRGARSVCWGSVRNGNSCERRRARKAGARWPRRCTRSPSSWMR